MIAVLLSCLIWTAFSLQQTLRPGENHFRQWMVHHSKEYKSVEEYELRLQNFQASLVRIEEHSSKLSNGANFSLNKFSDLSPQEFQEKYLMKRPVKNPRGGDRRGVLKPAASASALPTKFDWRDKKVVSPVKDQGQCGSCWAFSAVENVESVWMLAKNITQDKMPALAPQQVVDCSYLDLGCNGGNPPFAYEYIMSSGLETNSDYPYTAKDGTCSYNKAEVYATIKTWKWATNYDNEVLLQQNLMSFAPLSICVDASNWQDYSSGIMTGSQCCSLCFLDHCVQLVGYDNSGSTGYWIVRNSWGSDWGVDGYIWLQMGHNVCGLTDEATSVVV